MATYKNGVLVPVAPAPHEGTHVDGGSDDIDSALATGAIPNLSATKITADRLASINRLPTLTTDKILKGVAGVPAESDPFDIFDKFRDFIPWTSLDGFTVDGDAGYAVTVKGTCIYILTGGVINNRTFCQSTEAWRKLVAAGKKITVEFILQRFSAVSNQNIWLRIDDAPEDPPNEISSHFGWKIIGKDIYASNADWAAQDLTDTGENISSNDVRKRLKLVLNPGTDCKFYVDDVLKVTHTTHLPTEEDCYLYLYFKTLIGTAREMRLGRVLLEREN